MWSLNRVTSAPMAIHLCLKKSQPHRTYGVYVHCLLDLQNNNVVVSQDRGRAQGSQEPGAVAKWHARQIVSIPLADFNCNVIKIR